MQDHSAANYSPSTSTDLISNPAVVDTQRCQLISPYNLALQQGDFAKFGTLVDGSRPSTITDSHEAENAENRGTRSQRSTATTVSGKSSAQALLMPDK